MVEKCSSWSVDWETVGNTVTVIVKESMFSQMVKGSTVIYLAPNFGDLKTILGHHSKAVLNWTRLPSKICLHYYK